MNSGDLLYVAGAENEECELKIKEETGADIRVIPFNQKEVNEELTNCIYCDNKAKKVAVFARAY